MPNISEFDIINIYLLFYILFSICLFLSTRVNIINLKGKILDYSADITFFGDFVYSIKILTENNEEISFYCDFISFQDFKYIKKKNIICNFVCRKQFFNSTKLEKYHPLN